MELHVASQMQARMMAAAAVGAASTSSFAAISYTYGGPTLEAAQVSLQPDMERFKALFRRVDAEVEAEEQAMDVCLLTDHDARLWFSAPVCDIEEAREQLSSPQTLPGIQPMEMDSPAPVQAPFQLSTLVDDNNCVERLLPEMLVAEDPEPICGLPACFHAGDACAVAVIHWSATVDLRSMYERAVLAEQAEAPVVQECALPTCLHQGDSCAVAVIDPSETIDLGTIHELVVLVEQAKQAMAMLRGAADLKRVQREWDALEGGSFCMAENAPEDEGPNVDVDVKDKDKENVHGNDNGNNDNHNDDDKDGGAEPAIGLGSGEVAVRVRELSARVQSTTLPWLREGRERATRFLAVTIVRAYFFFWSSVGVAHLLMADSDARAGMLAACILAWVAFRVVKRRREAAVQVEKRQREAAVHLEKRLREMSARVDDAEARLDSTEASNHCLKQHLFIAHREAAESERKMNILRERLAGEIRGRKAAVQEQRQRVDLLQSLPRERNERPGARAEGERKEERQVLLERMEVVRRKLAVLERLERAGADNEAFRLERAAARAEVEGLVLKTLQHGINPSDLRPAAGVNRA